MSSENILKTVVEDIRVALQQQAGRRAVFQAALSKQAVQAYLADYYAGDFYKDIEALDKRFTIPAVQTFEDGKSMMTGSLISSEPLEYDTILAEGGVRPAGVYPLGLEEVGAAGEVFSVNPLFKKTIAGFQGGMMAYLGHLLSVTEGYLVKGRIYEDAEEDADAISMTDTALSDMHDAASGSSFINELLPVILSKWENSSRLSGEEFRTGLVFAFKRSSFKSFEGSVSKPTITHCPFSKLVGHLVDTVIEKDERGNFVPAERTEPGALLMFIAGRVEELEASRAKSHPRADVATGLTP